MTGIEIAPPGWPYRANAPLDAVNEILGETDVPVIFITAYPEQVLTGLRPEPIFLIPKPFRHETVKAVISQALFFDVKAKGAKASGA